MHKQVDLFLIGGPQWGGGGQLYGRLKGALCHYMGGGLKEL
jgi:hypothetical protein